MIGNIRKMRVALAEPVQYELPVGDQIVSLNEAIGGRIRLSYQGEINCIACGRGTKKSYSQGYCYPCFISLAACDMCIVKPETCHFAEGTCREPDWAMDNCMQHHYVYLANSSGLKVGITRGTQVPTRWIDQGAAQALPIYRVTNRYLSGLVEVALKEHVSDRTDWRKMLRGDAQDIDLARARDELVAQAADEIQRIHQQFGANDVVYLPDEAVTRIRYPVAEYPKKVSSLNLDKTPEIDATLLGIKGQYLIMDRGVINIRKFAGYKLAVELN